MKKSWIAVGLTVILIMAGCSSQLKSTKAADWDKYSEINFVDGLAFLLCNEMSQGKKLVDRDYLENLRKSEGWIHKKNIDLSINDEGILDEYMISMHYDEYKARLQTKHQLVEFKRRSMSELKGYYNPEKKYVFHANNEVDQEYNRVLKGFKLLSFETSVLNTKVKSEIAPQKGIHNIGGPRISFSKKDAGFEVVTIRFNNSGYILPMDAESATHLLKQGLPKIKARVVYVYKINNCLRFDKNVVRCEADIIDGYIYDRNRINSSMAPSGKIQAAPSLHIPSSEIKNWLHPTIN